MHVVPRPHPHSLDELEDNIAELVGQSTAVMPRMPTYVQHHPQVDEVGRLSAEALAMQYEGAAKQIEAMGNSLTAEMRRCEEETIAMVRNCERVREETAAAVDVCQQTAAAYRDEAKALFERIQSRSIMAEKVKTACSSMMNEIKL
jgi:hypothetical protein